MASYMYQIANYLKSGDFIYEGFVYIGFVYKGSIYKGSVWYFV
jgi:hypothetical protein